MGAICPNACVSFEVLTLKSSTADIIKALHDYIETFKSMSADRCEKLIYIFRGSLKARRVGLALSRRNLQFSYDDVRKCMLADDCKEEFCRQLSDQLVFCQRCGQKPILYNIIRDEDAMKRHLCDHTSEERSADLEGIRQMLLSRLQEGPLL